MIVHGHCSGSKKSSRSARLDFSRYHLSDQSCWSEGNSHWDKPRFMTFAQTGPHSKQTALWVKRPAQWCVLNLSVFTVTLCCGTKHWSINHFTSASNRKYSTTILYFISGTLILKICAQAHHSAVMTKHSDFLQQHLVDIRWTAHLPDARTRFWWWLQSKYEDGMFVAFRESKNNFKE